METHNGTQPEFIALWANKIKELRLTTPAILLLEIHKPFSFIAGQFLLVGQPFLDPFLPANFSANAVTLLSNRSHLDTLLREMKNEI